MSSIPLYLKIKGGSSTEGEFIPSHFSQTSPCSIEFNETQYDFAHIYNEQDTDYHHLLTNDRSSCVILIGPTGSGKTTMIKQLAAGKIKSFAPVGPPPVGSLVPPQAFVTAFEITNNKYILDLFDDNLHRRIPLFNYESQLKREKVNEDTLKHIFKKRLSQATEFNPNSSRSCLVITFYYQNHRTTLIDLMGNERNNVFANTNISSITQLLATKQNVGRSNNLVTNMIFKNHEIQMVMTLDPRGDAGLIKSTLTNVANLLNNFKLSSPVKAAATSRVPSYARPTASSKTLTKVAVPRKTVLAPKRPVPTRAIPKRTIVVKRPSSSYIPPSSPIKQRRLDEIAKLEQTIENLQSLNSQLQQQLNEISTKQDMNEHSQIIDLRAQIESQREKFVNHVNEIKSDFVNIKTESSILGNSFQSIGQNLDLISQKLTEAESSIQQKDEFITKLQKELDEQSRSLTSYESEVFRLKTESEDNKSAATETMDKMIHTKVQLTERVTDLQAQLDAKEDAIIKLNEELDVKSKLVHELQDLITKNSQKIEMLENEVVILKNQVELKTQQFEELDEIKNESESKGCQIEALNTDCNRYMEEIEVLQKKLVEQEQNSSNIEQSNIDSKAEHEQQVEILNQEIQLKSNELADMHEQLEKLKADHELELSQEKKSHCDAKSKWKQSVEELQHKNSKKKEEIEKLKKEVQARDDTIKSAASELEQKIQEISNLKSQINDYDLEQTHLKDLVERNHKSIQDWENKYNDMVSLKDDELKKLHEQLDYSTGDQLLNEMNLVYPRFNPEEIYQDGLTDDMTINFKPPSDMTTVLKPASDIITILNPAQSDVALKPDVNTTLKPPKNDASKILKPSTKLNSSPSRPSSKLGSSPLKRHSSVSPKKKRKNPNLESIKAKYQKLGSPLA
ncbi:uncharacterized protein SPAPADRAFT_49118 [Spathaspora passalidarum NRRL Y-27907]|uniref:Kinesin motor domain-containing protein n=1 Tax=Spathaspora passalidarum (strain NRRL Y-27907 / 11-Y1) TaxID=619300 RepID=G3AJY6_SPAPN|nr:uncharacterized protein SPAPADRAFT_49118 [Spathaspora passalidarum NRRL Y-27907]EGW34037.1 hypothetical protein SPAPADRAFT_49118 [Spathaspora passalidarum NRRL Y-27907]